MRTRYYSLKNPRIRQSWNKYNLYNLSQARPQRLDRANFFQQKWKAKAITRAYHGEQVREHQWERMFSPHLASVVSMDHNYLAVRDGSDESAGRGMGLKKFEQKKPPAKIPYMNMTFAPLERRLDTAVFRAMFASSIRQARQFVIHGHVKVNGKKMPHAGYMLNPGDMFSVDPERVLFATGRQSNSEAYDIEAEDEDTEGFTLSKTDPEDSVEASSTEDASTSQTDSLSDSPEDESTLSPESTALITSVQSLLSTTDESTLSAKQKPPYRTLKRLSTNLHPSPSPSALSSLSSALEAFQLSLSSSSSSPPSSDLDTTDEQAKPPPPALDAHWKPRPYLGPFAFIPQYLEVSHAVCAAVYLRHPVARAGYAEVPSPWPIDSHQLAHNWYLRRR